MSLDRYAGRRVFVTGHTGFKGSWLVAWLTRLGAEVTGYALAPEPESHYRTLSLPVTSLIGDINDFDALARAMAAAQPDVVFHLAAQPLVRVAYDTPVETFETNVIGSLKVYRAALAARVPALVSVTTDKVYENREWPWGYREIDPLGGHDPYSASKACVEVMTESFRKSYLSGETPPMLLATLRAGNVIGGGDWAKDRLIPDIVRAARDDRTLTIRNPDAVRPWQHVLDPLDVYLRVGARLMDGDRAFATAFNIGPSGEDSLSVRQIVDLAVVRFPNLRVAYEAPTVHEHRLLRLDSSKLRAQLDWQPRWTAAEAIALTWDWYQRPTAESTKEQIGRFMEPPTDSDAGSL